MRANVITCRLRRDGKYLVVIADTVGGRNMREVLSDKPVSEGSDVTVRDGKVVG